MDQYKKLFSNKAALLFGADNNTILKEIINAD